MFQPDFTFKEKNQQIMLADQMNLIEYLQQIPDFRRKQGLRAPVNGGFAAHAHERTMQISRNSSLRQGKSERIINRHYIDFINDQP